MKISETEKELEIININRNKEGVKAFDDKDYITAIKCFEDSLSYDTDGTIYYNLGNTYYQLVKSGDDTYLDEAIMNLASAAAKKHSGAYYLLGKIFDPVLNNNSNNKSIYAAIYYYRACIESENCDLKKKCMCFNNLAVDFGKELHDNFLATCFSKLAVAGNPISKRFQKKYSVYSSRLTETEICKLDEINEYKDMMQYLGTNKNGKKYETTKISSPDKINSNIEAEDELPKKKGNTIKKIIIFLVVFFILCEMISGIGSISSGGSQDCAWCGKTIFSDGRAIHATNEFLNTYKCNYCGHLNVH